MPKPCPACREAVWSIHAKSKDFILKRKMLSNDLKLAQKSPRA